MPPSLANITTYKMPPTSLIGVTTMLSAMDALGAHSEDDNDKATVTPKFLGVINFK
jgi:hypothetical protein